MSTTAAAANSTVQHQDSLTATAPVATAAEDHGSQPDPGAAGSSASGRAQPGRLQQETSTGSVQSPDFDVSFAGEAEAIFNAGQGIQYKVCATCLADAYTPDDKYDIRSMGFVQHAKCHSVAHRCNKEKQFLLRTVFVLWSWLGHRRS